MKKMRRLETFTHSNQWLILPALYITTEPKWYLYLEFQWLRWGISLTIYDKQTKA